MYKKKPRSPEAYQLTCGRLSTHESSISGHSSDSSFSEEEPFCLQMKVQDKKAHTSVPIHKHLVTNLEFQVKPHKRKTKFLWARVDTCADVNLMPVSIYNKLLKDEDCSQNAPSNLQMATYTNKKVKMIGSCNLYIIYPDTRCLEDTQFYAAGNEGSILISCTTSLALSLMKLHEKLDHPPPEGNRNAIYSSVDKIKKWDESQLNVHQLVRKPKLKASKEAPIVCPRDGQLKSKKEQCNSSKEQSNDNTCTRDKGDKNCQVEKSVNMCPTKPAKDMQLPKPAIRRMCSDKNCQSTRCTV